MWSLVGPVLLVGVAPVPPPQWYGWLKGGPPVPAAGLRVQQGSIVEFWLKLPVPAAKVPSKFSAYGAVITPQAVLPLTGPTQLDVEAVPHTSRT